MGLETWGCPGFGGLAWGCRGPGICSLAPPQARLCPSQLGDLGLHQSHLPAAPRLGAVSAEPVGIRPLAPACAHITIRWAGRQSRGTLPHKGLFCWLAWCGLQPQW